MTETSPNPTTERAAGKPARRSFLGLVILLVAVWAAAMFFRWEIRARWWAWQITRTETREDRDYYLTRLASIRDKSLSAVDALLEDPRPDIRDAGITVLRQCQSERAADRLMAMLGDASPDVAGMAATALAWRPESTRYIGPLESILNRAGPPQWGAAVALGRIGGPEAERALEGVLRQPDSVPEVRAQAIDSLGMLGCRHAIDLMDEALQDHRVIRTLPFSQLSARRAITALQSDLRTRGVDPAQAMAAVDSPPTVAAVAQRWHTLLTHKLDLPASRPESRIAD